MPKRADPHRPVRYVTPKGAAGRVRWPARPTVYGELVHGWTEDGHISVSMSDSTPEQADTLIHELMHAERPGWSEATVKEATAAVCASIARNPGPWLWAIWALTRG